MLDRLLSTQPVRLDAQRDLRNDPFHFGKMLAALSRDGFLWTMRSQAGNHHITLRKAGLQVEGHGPTAEEAIRSAADLYDAEAARIIKAETEHRPLPGNAAQLDTLILDAESKPRALTGRKRRRG